MLTTPAVSWNPRPYQMKGVEIMISQACAGLLYKPGLGKTSVVYMAFRILQDKGYVKKMLVIAPIRPAYVVWPEQKDKFLEFKHFRVAVLHGPNKEKLLASNDYDIYVINPEGLPWLLKDPSRVNKFDMLVVDESIKFANPQTQRFKLLKNVIKKFKRRYILNGSPRPKSLMDLFGQIYILDEGSSLGRFITHYRTQHFYPSGYGGYTWTPQPGAEQRIGEKIAPLVQVVEQKGNIDLPELMINDIWVDLPSDAMLRYRSMEEQLIALVDSGAVVAANAAVASGKCRQMANGILLHGDDTYTEIHDEKLMALQDLMEQLQGEPLLITFEFVADRQRIEKKLEVPCISTGRSSWDNAHIRKFANGDLPAVMGHPQSISLGIDGLQNACCNIAMFGVPWSFLNYEQVIDRVKRVGNKSNTVILHRILARDTIDEQVIRVLDGRERGQERFMEMLKGMAANRPDLLHSKDPLKNTIGTVGTSML